jgi:hypothetical protein
MVMNPQKEELNGIVIKDLLKSNIYDVNETIVIIGSCLPYMDKDAYKKIIEICSNVYDLCLEQTHINMAITKIGGMLRTGKIKKIIFASVNKSPHCIQMHYIQDELCKMMDLKDMEIINYVAEKGELVNIPAETIKLSKNLIQLQEFKDNN